MWRTLKQTYSHSMHRNISPPDTDVNPSEASGTTPVQHREARIGRRNAACGTVISTRRIGHISANLRLGALTGAVRPLADNIGDKHRATSYLSPPRAATLATRLARFLLRSRRCSTMSPRPPSRGRVGPGGYIFLAQKPPIVHSGQRSVDHAMIRATLSPPALTFE